jgi:hypothetical protein
MSVVNDESIRRKNGALFGAGTLTTKRKEGRLESKRQYLPRELAGQHTWESRGLAWEESERHVASNMVPLSIGNRPMRGTTRCRERRSECPSSTTIAKESGAQRINWQRSEHWRRSRLLWLMTVTASAVASASRASRRGSGGRFPSPHCVRARCAAGTGFILGCRGPNSRAT